MSIEFKMSEVHGITIYPTWEPLSELGEFRRYIFIHQKEDLFVIKMEGKTKEDVEVEIVEFSDEVKALADDLLSGKGPNYAQAKRRNDAARK